jgi:hypothetical protein
VTKPACSACDGYNATDWSSVTSMVASPSSPGHAPDLLTDEVVNGTGSVWLYEPVVGSFAYHPPTLISTYTSSWAWDDFQLIAAGPLPGTNGITLWTRAFNSGRVYQLHDIEAGIPDPSGSAIQVGDNDTFSSYPLLTTVGQADDNGNLAMWATDADGHLVLIPTTTDTSGVTTVGSPAVRSDDGWASHEMTLGPSYVNYNNEGVGWDDGNTDPFDTASQNAFAYSSSATGEATFNDPNTLVNDGAGGCPTGWDSCDPSLGGFNTLFVPNGAGLDRFVLPAPWAHRNDNYIAAGQVLPVGTPDNGQAAQHISFLGAAALDDPSTGASVDVTVTYTDGNTQTITITFADWTHNLADDSDPIGGDITVATMDHRLVASTGATDDTTTYLFATPDIALRDNGGAVPDGVQIASVTLGSNDSVHIFSVSTS